MSTKSLTKNRKKFSGKGIPQEKRNCPRETHSVESSKREKALPGKPEGLKMDQSQRWVMMWRMMRSVSCIPSLARTPTLAMVLSTPLVTMPSPLLNSWWLRHMW